jgi:hypothetical protein
MHVTVSYHPRPTLAAHSIARRRSPSLVEKTVLRAFHNSQRIFRNFTPSVAVSCSRSPTLLTILRARAMDCVILYNIQYLSFSSVSQLTCLIDLNKGLLHTPP